MSAPVWRGPPAGALRVVALDQLTAIFHRPSGQTHIVDAPAPELLVALGPDWTDADTLLARLAADYDMPDADAHALAARLDELAECGLVERG